MSATENRLAVLFPGQGSQEKGMGRVLAEASADAAELWRLAEKASGLPLREIYWEGDEAAMADTRALQPAMTAVTLGLWLALRDKLSGVVGFAGHSLGEYAALAASGMLEVAAALELTSLRGRLMAEAAGGEGKMAAVLKLSLEAIEDVVATAKNDTGKLLVIANYNSPGQYVISGEGPAVAAAAELAKARKGRAIPLAVSGAFHSPLMAEPAKELEKALRKAGLRAQTTAPVFFNVTGAAESDPDKALDLICRQMTSQVRWIDTMTALHAAGARTFVELGPKTVLTKLVSANLKDAGGEYAAVSVSDPAGAAALGA
ncbi:Acyl transferase [Solidesulfovibrio fructosivorans JJ]]|uniref:Malonyl CoA-acyl carrier protein transacylase n=1 Tax=Solidesulfovibrio fructosivorans JJ] TaxID=596151 RepID=E1JYT6_SOLFR|nr:ACP S-malonyltransferase [Solidesulfovibrio fructosivorans]EFL50506.1 Acyl transferase [Solidesulfovibrio fructosivorans JJ]]